MATFNPISSKGIKVPSKPVINPNLKIRAMTDPEKMMADRKAKYTDRNGNMGIGGAAKLLGDMGATAVKRVFGIDGYKKGGKVKKTGLALVHKGERVLTKKQQAKLKLK